MSYLLNLQRAIAQTGTTESLSPQYVDGWSEAGLDVSYGVQCGSEHAVKSQMAPWLMGEDNPYFENLDSERDKGYAERVKAIQLILEQTI